MAQAAIGCNANGFSLVSCSDGRQIQPRGAAYDVSDHRMNEVDFEGSNSRFSLAMAIEKHPSPLSATVWIGRNIRSTAAKAFLCRGARVPVRSFGPRVPSRETSQRNGESDELRSCRYVHTEIDEAPFGRFEKFNLLFNTPSAKVFALRLLPYETSGSRNSQSG